jgi:hypothetical protein
MRNSTGIAAALVVAAAVAGCSSSGSSAAPAPTVTVTQTGAAVPSTTPTASTSPSTGATDLVLTQAVRAALIHAQAQVENLPDSAYTALAKGTAYYALDRDTGTYWAGASLIPSKHSMRAQVSTQDDGGYLLFVMKPDGAWKVYNAGLDGEPDSTGCPVAVPADVLVVWRWKPKSCNPPFN